MNKANCFYLGYVSKLHGFKGEVSLFLDVTNPNDYKSLDSIFIDLGNLTPFFIQSIKLNNKGFSVVRLQGVNDEINARKLLRKDIYLPIERLPKLDGLNFYDHEVIGYNVFDEANGYIGELNSVIDFKLNPLLQIMKDEKEILIPLVKGIVKKVDRDNKKLHIKSPEGLVQLYLGE